MATDLFGSCDVMTLSGIKSLKLMAQLTGGTSISFPLDFTVLNGEESTILGTDDNDNQQLTIGNQTMVYVEPTVLNSSFEETEVKDRRGTYYNINLTIEFPKIQLYTNNQIKDFLFNSDGQFAIANAVAVIRDNNDVDWIAGYDLPLVVESLEVTTGGDDNKYTMTLLGRSYNRIRRFQYQ